jgi:predicted ATPase/DNA-binding winged helix-turn-helix (wHTH) protein
LSDQVLSFGPFRLVASERALLKEGKPLRVGARALDILLTLSERPGHIFTKDELIARVWPDTHVDEISLRVHIAALRKILGDGARYITNVPGRGYSFTAKVAARLAASALSDGAPSALARLPAPGRMVGRDEAAARLEAKLAEHRFVTVVGPGGIGKTTLGLVVANRCAPRHADGAVFVDLAPLNNPALVPSTAASALGVSARSADPLAGMLAFLKDKQLLLMLDNCEHVIDAAAKFAEELYRQLPGLTILATSQEPLRADGEWVHRLAPLAAPPPQSAASAAEALAFPCIQLFAERLMASMDAFDLQDADVPHICELCRKLDGNPLAIELAAARVEQFGLSGLRAKLEDRFAVLTRGRRTAMPRHQTLRATLDWSYSLLPEPEKIVLRRLAIFRNAFTLEAAVEVAGDARHSADGIHDIVGNLAAKSLISVDVNAEIARHRLLESTRAYALEKLAENGEQPAITARHAEYIRTLMIQAASEWETLPPKRWLAVYARLIDDVRAALEASFAANGSFMTGLDLAIASAPLWFQLSLAEEYCHRLERALDDAPPFDVEQEVALKTAYAQALWQARGPVPAVEASFRRVLEIADGLGRSDRQLQALWGIWTARNGSADYPVLAEVTKRMEEIATSTEDERLRLSASRSLAFAHHFLGRNADAARYAEVTLAYAGRGVRPARSIGFQFDQELAMRTLMAPGLWIRGYPEQAMALARECVEAGIAARHALSLCYVLALGATPVAIWCGDDKTARFYTALLKEQSEQHSLVHWQNWAICFAAALDAQDGKAVGGAPGVGALGTAPIILLQYQVLATLNGGLAIPELIAAPEDGDEGWCTAELLRIKGERLAATGKAEDLSAAETLYRRAIDIAARQEAPAWGLRAAMSRFALARKRGGACKEEAGQLASIYGKFAEGFETIDLRKAKAHLEEFGAPPDV